MADITFEAWMGRAGTHEEVEWFTEKKRTTSERALATGCTVAEDNPIVLVEPYSTPPSPVPNWSWQFLDDMPRFNKVKAALCRDFQIEDIGFSQECLFVITDHPPPAQEIVKYFVSEKFKITETRLKFEEVPKFRSWE
jgi:hypothetical protein